MVRRLTNDTSVLTISTRHLLCPLVLPQRHHYFMTDISQIDPSMQANSDPLNLGWAWAFVVFPAILILNDFFHFLPSGTFLTKLWGFMWVINILHTKYSWECYLEKMQNCMNNFMVSWKRYYSWIMMGSTATLLRSTDIIRLDETWTKVIWPSFLPGAKLPSQM